MRARPDRCVLIAALLGLATSCAPTVKGPPTTTASSHAPQPAVAPTPAAFAPPPSPTAPVDADGLGPLEDAQPPDGPIRWRQSPSCPLTYDHRVLHHTEAAGMGMRTGIDVSGQLDARAAAADPNRIALVHGWLRMDVVGPGGPVRGARSEEALGATEMKTDGARWTPLPGSPRANAALVFLPSGVERVWPALPASSAVGSEVQWDVPGPAEGGIAGAMTMVANQHLPRVASAPLRISKWVRVRGELACVLEGAWEREQASDQKQAGVPTHTRASLRGGARFVVLASGRLLSARVRQAFDLSIVNTGDRAQDLDGLGVAAPATQDVHNDTTQELRLVKACDGATMPPLHPPPTLEEQALGVHGKLVRAATRADRAALVALVAPELTRAHGQEAVVNAIVQHVKRFGETSLGVSGTMPGSLRASGDRVEIPMTGFIRANPVVATVAVAVVMAKQGDSVHVRSIKVTMATTEPPTVLLDVSDERLHSGTAPAPNPGRPRNPTPLDLGTRQ